MQCIGIVTSGLGEASFWVKKIEDVFMKKINKNLFYGTLNIKLGTEFIINNPTFEIKKEEYGGSEDLLFLKCKVLGVESYIIRTNSNNTKGMGAHSLNIIEVISDVNFRQNFKLKDNDMIKLEIGE